MKRFCCCALAALVLFGGVVFGDDLELHFLNVGQGDCTLIMCPNGLKVLIDCGTLSGGNPTEIRQYLLDQLGEPREIDVLVITHPDSDHYSLLPQVLEGVSIKRILLTDVDEEYPKAGVSAWLGALGDRKRILNEDHFDPPDVPSDLFDGGDVRFHVLAANTVGTLSPTNTKSIVLMVSFGEFDALLTGDATRDTEARILSRYEPEWLDVELLKLGHHGSEATSTSADWVAATRPEIATVSCGYNNSFAHPRREVVQRVEPFTMSATAHKFRWGFNPPGPSKVQFQNFETYPESVFTTARNGNIVVRSDGNGFTVNFEGESHPFTPDALVAHSTSIEPSIAREMPGPIRSMVRNEGGELEIIERFAKPKPDELASTVTELRQAIEKLKAEVDALESAKRAEPSRESNDLETLAKIFASMPQQHQSDTVVILICVGALVLSLQITWVVSIRRRPLFMDSSRMQ